MSENLKNKISEAPSLRAVIDNPTVYAVWLSELQAIVNQPTVAPASVAKTIPKVTPKRDLLE